MKMYLKNAKNGIEPLVTLCHYDTPLYLEEELGGWVNRDLIGYFEQYVTVVFDGIKSWSNTGSPLTRSTVS